jgi:hypothetical protein
MSRIVAFAGAPVWRKSGFLGLSPESAAGAA